MAIRFFNLSNSNSALTRAGLALVLLLNLIQPVFANADYNNDDTNSRWHKVEQRRKEVQERVRQARKKEELALQKLHRIESKLNATKGVLIENKHELQKTQIKLNETKQKIVRTQSTEAQLTDQAAQRLREIYEGHRLSLLEMLFQVTSLQSMLDLFYYQERIADSDRKLLDELKQKAQLLAAKKDKLGMQQNKLGELISEVAKQASQIAREKFSQEQIADRLKSQRAFWENAEAQLAAESQQLERQIVNLESSRRGTQDMAVGSGNMMMPIRARITSPFGSRPHPIFHVRRFHSGIDLAGPNHAPIRAADSGCVLQTGWFGGYGRHAIISHGNGKSTLYAHMSVVKVTPGQNVQKGDIVGYEGTTGFSTGPHLHFEVRINGKPNNPLNYVH